MSRALTFGVILAARGRGNFKRPTPDRNTLSEKELAELQKIEAKKEKLRLDRIAKYEAKKAKKLAKKVIWDFVIFTNAALL